MRVVHTGPALPLSSLVKCTSQRSKRDEKVLNFVDDMEKKQGHPNATRQLNGVLTHVIIQAQGLRKSRSSTHYWPPPRRFFILYLGHNDGEFIRTNMANGYVGAQRNSRRLTNDPHPSHH